MPEPRRTPAGGDCLTVVPRPMTGRIGRLVRRDTAELCRTVALCGWTALGAGVCAQLQERSADLLPMARRISRTGHIRRGKATLCLRGEGLQGITRVSF